MSTDKNQNPYAPDAIRLEICEREILRALDTAPKTKGELRVVLENYFGIKQTPTQKDDNKLQTYFAKVLTRLKDAKIIVYDGKRYSISKDKMARIDNITEILTLETQFLSLLHQKGGAFFESYFMQLLEKYLIRCGKSVRDAHVTGGSNDGGIDGIAYTVDSLGFRETVMVQTKNRNEIVSETEVRGFYGAVCAKNGSRGIFATTADFHSEAKKFLDSIDTCVGLNGKRIFAMACDCSYGIRRSGKKLMLDAPII